MDRTNETPEHQEQSTVFTVTTREKSFEDPTRTLALALIGLAGGILGAFAMNVYARTARVFNEEREVPGAAPGSDRDGRGVQPAQARDRAENDAATRVGTAAYKAVMRREPDRTTERRLGSAVHYAFGAAAGTIYALASEDLPMLRKGFGSFYGSLVWAIADEGFIPAIGLSREPRNMPADVHAYALSGHCVYGAALECVRRLGTHAWDRYRSPLSP
jgi:hypothetical protein